MKLKSKIFLILLALVQLFNTSSHAGKIYDYTYEGEQNEIIVANRNAGKKVALTFDDGPCVLYTQEILNILKENNAKATFFVIGSNAEKHPELVLVASKDGHEIANHTYSHLNLRTVNKTTLSGEIEKTNEIIKNITGKRPVLFRPPGGYLNNMIVECIAESNCRPVLWSWRQDTEDWKKTPPDLIVKKVINNLQDGDIILFHDYNSEGSPTPAALRILLPRLSEMGYSFVSVSEIMGITGTEQ